MKTVVNTPQKPIDDNTILDCGHKPSKHDSHTTGYGQDANGKTFCFDCCALQDKEHMRTDKKITLYLVENNQYVTNWPNTLRIKVNNSRVGNHNIAGKRIDVWFYFEDNLWHGVHYGQWNDLVHCKQVKNV